MQFGMDAFWVVDFPLFARAELTPENAMDTAQAYDLAYSSHSSLLLESSHHPFTAPQLEHERRFRDTLDALDESDGMYGLIV